MRIISHLVRLRYNQEAPLSRANFDMNLSPEERGSIRPQILRVMPQDPGTCPEAAGLMFWLTRKKFVGSNSLLIRASRS
jgi:hypothetical protein